MSWIERRATLDNFEQRVLHQIVSLQGATRGGAESGREPSAANRVIARAERFQGVVVAQRSLAKRGRTTRRR